MAEHPEAVRAVRVELGARVLLVEGVEALWHVPDPLNEEIESRWDERPRSLCGLAGEVYAYNGVVTDRRLCSVCSGRAPADLHVAELGPLPVRGRKRGRPFGKSRLITDLQLRALYQLYEQGWSLNQIAGQVHARLGYKTANSCAVMLSEHFRAAGYELRDRIAATVLASTKNGLSPRDWKERRARRLAAGLTLKGKERRPRCAAQTTGTSHRRRRRCSRPALLGSEFCWSHDPDRAAEREAQVAAMRARSPLQMARVA